MASSAKEQKVQDNKCNREFQTWWTEKCGMLTKRLPPTVKNSQAKKMQSLRFVMFAAIMCLFLSARVSTQHVEMSTDDDGNTQMCLMVPDQMMSMVDSVCKMMNWG
ncbi:hypothetical protein HNY73_013910 [Argiope bruennichi]|uniref:Uncharacterized protein n=1 Tax=Argiope bruennichi TaxID=94029 RepID=A0A8T0ESJ4_ARGBR|nr:hypothetical protein HNY73_013910 [Argiope bruennichi]